MGYARAEKRKAATGPPSGIEIRSRSALQQQALHHAAVVLPQVHQIEAVGLAGEVQREALWP